MQPATGTSQCYRARGSNAGPVWTGPRDGDPAQAGRPTDPTMPPGHSSGNVTGVWPPTGGRWPNKPTAEREDLSGRRSARSASWDGGDTGRDDQGPQGRWPARTGSASERRSLTARSEIGLLLKLLSRRERRSIARRVLRVDTLDPAMRRCDVREKRGHFSGLPRSRLPGQQQEAYLPTVANLVGLVTGRSTDHFLDRASPSRWDRPVGPDPNNLS